MTEIKEWLTAEEKKGLHLGYPHSITDAQLQNALESLAASRASEDRKRKLLEKHQWISGNYYFCPECRATYSEKHDGMKHHPGCAIAAHLGGIGGK